MPAAFFFVGDFEVDFFFPAAFFFVGDFEVDFFLPAVFFFVGDFEVDFFLPAVFFFVGDFEVDFLPATFFVGDFFEGLPLAAPPTVMQRKGEDLERTIGLLQRLRHASAAWMYTNPFLHRPVEGVTQPNGLLRLRYDGFLQGVMHRPLPSAPAFGDQRLGGMHPRGVLFTGDFCGDLAI